MKQTKEQRVENARAEWDAYLSIPPDDRPYKVFETVEPAYEIEKGRGPLYSLAGHTKECEEASRQFNLEVAAFIAKHPDYCQTCGGWGMLSSRGCSVPYGNTYVSLPDEVDLCPDCLEKDLCPQCGQPTLDEAAERCGFCGWEYGQSEGIPEAPGCLCPDPWMFADWPWADDN